MDAKALGIKFYCNGIPCKRGHVSPRLTVNGDCCECRKERKAAWSRNNKERNAEHSRNYAKRHPDRVRAANKVKYAKNIDAEREKRVARYYENPEAAKESSRGWYRQNKDRAIARQNVWRAENWDKVLETSRRRTRLKRESVEHYTADDVAELLRKQPGCPDCGRKFTAKLPHTVDHVVPLSKGGDNSKRNIELRCKPCNSRKHARDPLEHARILGRLL